MDASDHAGGESNGNDSASFLARFINPTTVLIIEDDSYAEQPHIYVKIYPDLLIITDTGCNSPRQKHKSIISLRTFLETVPITPSKIPLNPSGSKKYVIICTHAQYVTPHRHRHR